MRIFRERGVLVVRVLTTAASIDPRGTALAH